MMLLSKDEMGHWNFKKFDPTNHFGFLYCIHNKETGQFYLGKKQLFRGGKKKSPTYGKEMPWRTYTGSSIELNKDIKKQGRNGFKFDIIDTYQTKGGLYYAEAYSQMMSDALTAMLTDGKTPKSYNRQIAAIRFIPKEEATTRTKKYINSLKGK